jgi:hypothetical protein
MPVELGLDLGAVPDQQEFGIRMPPKGNGSAGYDDGGADIAAHGVKRNSNLAWHQRSGNLVSCGLELAAAKWLRHQRWRSAKRHGAPGPGRDNSVSPRRNNLLTPAFYIQAKSKEDSHQREKLNPNQMDISTFRTGSAIG